MGRRKTRTSGSSRNSSGKRNTRKVSTKNTKTFLNDLQGGFFVIFGLILLVFLVFSSAGTVSGFINNISKGFFGKLSVLISAVLIFVGIHEIASDEKIKPSSEILKGIILVTLICSVVYSFILSNTTLFDNPIKFISDTYNAGVDGTNISGLLGAIIATLFVSLIGKIATRILLIFITLITALCFFNMSFKDFFEGIYNVFTYIGRGISHVCSILFRSDDEEDDEDNIEEENQKLTRKQRKELEKMQEMQAKMEEKGSPNTEKNLRLANAEQLEFDFNKLGGKPSETEMHAKQQRDEFFKKQKEQKEDNSVKEVLTIDHTRLSEEENYEFPPIDLLGKPKAGESFDKKSIRDTAVKLQKTLASFGVEAKVTNITKGPTVTRYELTPSTGVKVSKIVNLSDDIALNLEAKSIRIEAPIPGKAAVGIEVPNKTAEAVTLREVIESDVFKKADSKLTYALGKDAAGNICVGDIAKMPHALIAGATGSGKSVCINSIIVSLLYKAKPSEVKMILIDPKMVELSGYNGIPHLLIPVVTDPKKAAGALNWAVQEMVKRYSLFASVGVKDLKGYNKIIEKKEGAKLPQIVIIVDELSDLMMVAPNDVEDAICRLAQMARAAGMHLIIATQRPSVDVITGIIKANVPSRIAFTVSSQVDSRTILDSAGAEKLLGRGDMLYFPTGEIKPLRMQGAFISEKEIEKIVDKIKENFDTTYSEDILNSIEKAGTSGSKGGADTSEDDEETDPLLEDAIDLVVDIGQASASMLQRRFKVGHSRAGRIIDQMEARGLISGYEGSKPRQVLVSKSEWQELKMGGGTEETSNISDSSDSTDTNDGGTNVIYDGMVMTKNFNGTNGKIKL